MMCRMATAVVDISLIHGFVSLQCVVDRHSTHILYIVSKYYILLHVYKLYCDLKTHMDGASFNVILLCLVIIFFSFNLLLVRCMMGKS